MDGTGLDMILSLTMIIVGAPEASFRETWGLLAMGLTCTSANSSVSELLVSRLAKPLMTSRSIWLGKNDLDNDPWVGDVIQGKQLWPCC